MATNSDAVLALNDQLLQQLEDLSAVITTQNQSIQAMTTHWRLAEERYHTLNRQFLRFLLTNNRSGICPQCWLADAPDVTTASPPTSPSEPTPDNQFEWPTYAPASPSYSPLNPEANIRSPESPLYRALHI